MAKVSTPLNPYCDYCQLLFAIQLYSFLLLVDRYICCSFIFVNGVSVCEICSCIPSAEASKRNTDRDCRAMRLCVEKQMSLCWHFERGAVPTFPRAAGHKELFSGTLPSYDAASEEAEIIQWASRNASPCKQAQVWITISLCAFETQIYLDWDCILSNIHKTLTQ